MNIRKPVDYTDLYAQLETALCRNKKQMDQYAAIGKAVALRSEKGAAVAAADYISCPTLPRKSCLSKRLAKTVQRGLVWEQGLFPYFWLRKPHTGGHAGDLSVMRSACSKKKQAPSALFADGACHFIRDSPRLYIYSCVFRFQNQKAPVLPASRMAAAAIHGRVLPADS